MDSEIIVTTRQSPLALAQTQIAIDYLQEKLPNHTFKTLPLTTTGDKQQAWSLEKRGGKGLFTKELEVALLDGRAHLAMHSAKDLPTTLPDHLTIAGYTGRENPTDTLIVKDSDATPATIASGSPRRKAQIALQFPNASFVEIRGRVQTRLEKLSDGVADATIMASAGLKRLGISSHPGFKFIELSRDSMVPAVGQGAIALECREDLADFFAPLLCSTTHYAITVERLFLAALGGGCHAAYAAHYHDHVLTIYHKACGILELPFKDIDLSEVPDAINEIISKYIKNG